MTTNYDRLLETAATASGYKELAFNSFTFHDAEKLAGCIYSGKAAVVHIHGDPTQIAIDDFVFTAEDYTRIDREFPGFKFSLQSLMLSFSWLFVGYGGSDPHIEDLVEELQFFLRWSRSDLLPTHYLLIKKDKSSRVLEKYKEKMRTDIIEIDDYSRTADFLEQLAAIAPRKPN